MKKVYLFTFAVSSILLAGCTTLEYSHSVYNFAEDRIPEFNVKGSVALENGQVSQAMQKSKSSGVTINYTFQQITEGYNRQFYTEIEKRANTLSAEGSKTLKTTISEFSCETKGMNTWVYKCTIKGNTITGDGQKIVIDYKHGAPVVAPIQEALDGMIAIAVENSLKNETILAYLAK